MRNMGFELQSVETVVAELRFMEALLFKFT